MGAEFFDKTFLYPYGISINHVLSCDCFYCRYGRTFMTNILGRKWVFASNREAAKLLFQSEHKLFQFGGTQSAKDMLGSDSIFYAGVDIHRKIRRLVGEPLLSDNLKKNFEKMEAICLETLDGWSGKTVSVFDGTSMVSNLIFI